MIEFKNVSKGFEKPVITNLSFSLEDGEAMGIYGESGIGKSTIIDLILGISKADQGEVRVSTDDFSVVFQEDRLIDELTAVENLALISDDRNLIKDILLCFNISDFDKKLYNFSGGMKRRVALARAYLKAGEMLILDEPFVGLDYENKMNAVSLLREKFAKKTIVLVSHNKEDFKYFGIDETNLIYL